MDIGDEEKETVVIEPITNPIKRPEHEPVPQTKPEKEPVKVGDER